MNDKRDRLQWMRKNFDIQETSRKRKNRASGETIGAYFVGYKK
jgi:hypothetical protein